jgi:hypothetical protein
MTSVFRLFSESLGLSCHQIDLAELIRNQQVVGSTPTGGSKTPYFTGVSGVESKVIGARLCSEIAAAWTIAEMRGVPFSSMIVKLLVTSSMSDEQAARVHGGA